MESGWERTLPYIHITLNTAKLLFKDVLRENEIRYITLIREGCRTTNYVVDTVYNKRFLLKIFYEKNTSYKKEIEIYLKLKDYVILPRIYKVDKSDYLQGREYIIFDYLEGQTLSNYVKKGNKITKKFVIQSADALANIHNIKYKAVGFLNEKLMINEELPPLYAWYRMFLEGGAKEKIGEKLVDKILMLVDRNRNILNLLDENPCLVHGDFQGTNILVNNNGDLCGMLDWEFCMAGHPIADIGQFFRYENYNDDMKVIFAEEYNTKSTYKLPDEWYKISKLRDMVNIIQILNNKISMPKKEKELLKIIHKNIYILQNYNNN